MKVSNEELVQLLKLSTKKPPTGSNHGWVATGVILFLTILAFLYENAGR